MKCRYSAVFIMSSLALSFAACSTEADSQREAAITHALANPDLQMNLAAFTAQGWTVSDRTAATVEWTDAATSSPSPAATAPAVLTRVRVPMVHPTQPGEPGMAADLVVAWSQDGTDEFAIMPRDEAADAELGRTNTAVDSPAAQALSPLADAATAAAACGRENAACGGATTCCRGLVCAEQQDNHFTCFCSSPVTIRYNSRSVVSGVCVDRDTNPIGAGRMVTTIRGCGVGGGLRSDACGKTISTPQYVRSTSTGLVCYFSPPHGCVSE